MHRLLIITAWMFLAALPVHAAQGAGDIYLQRAINYENGRGVTKDQQRAYRLYCLAAIDNNADAYYHLGWMQLNGRGVPSNRQIAAGWFHKGAEAGDRVSRNIMNRLANVERLSDPNCPGTEPNSDLDHQTIEKLVHLLAPEYGLDPKLVLALIKAESNFNPKAHSHKGAVGLMQLIPATAKRFGVRDIHDPLQNLHGGMAYLQWLSEYFKDDLPLVLAAYNAGEHAVKRYRGIPPYRETRHYVKQITRDYGKT